MHLKPSMLPAPFETSGMASAGPQTLIDRDLTPAAQATRDRAKISLIEPEERRVVAAFLGRDDYQEIQKTMPLTMARLFLECLPAMTHDLGGQVAWSLRPVHHREMNQSILNTVKVSGRSHLIFHEGYLFLHLPDELVVVSAEENRVGGLEVGVRSSACSTDFYERWNCYARQHNYLRGQAFFADGAIIERSRQYGWKDILLPEQTKQTILRHVDSFLKNRLRIREMGLKMRRGLILAGPPGTGKTLLGKVLSNTLDASFLWVSPRHIRSAGSFEEMMSLARFVAPVVVFMEDLDLFAEERDSDKWLGLGELMNQLDGAVDNEDIITVATTNRLDVIEKALRNRPGRFDRIIDLGGLDEHCRREMLSRLLTSAVLKPEDVDHMVISTDGYTGAQVEELANTLLLMWLDMVDRRPMESGHVHASISRQMIDAALHELHIERKSRLGFHTQ